MNRPTALALGTLLGLLTLLGPTASLHAQTQPIVPKATMAPDSAARQIQTSPETIMANLMMEPGTRKSAAQITPVKAMPENDVPSNWRMVVVALVLMAAIALRRRRGRA